MREISPVQSSRVNSEERMPKRYEVVVISKKKEWSEKKQTKERQKKKREKKKRKTCFGMLD